MGRAVARSEGEKETPPPPFFFFPPRTGLPAGCSPAAGGCVGQLEAALPGLLAFHPERCGEVACRLRGRKHLPSPSPSSCVRVLCPSFQPLLPTRSPAGGPLRAREVQQPPGSLFPPPRGSVEAGSPQLLPRSAHERHGSEGPSADHLPLRKPPRRSVNRP